MKPNKEHYKEQKCFGQKEKPYKWLVKAVCKVFNLVRVTGLEPVRHEHTPLKRACLPVPAHSHTTLIIISLIISVVNIKF